jgi:hypothetical protein
MQSHYAATILYKEQQATIQALTMLTAANLCDQERH